MRRMKALAACGAHTLKELSPVPSRFRTIPTELEASPEAIKWGAGVKTSGSGVWDLETSSAVLHLIESGKDQVVCYKAQAL